MTLLHHQYDLPLLAALAEAPEPFTDKLQEMQVALTPTQAMWDTMAMYCRDPWVTNEMEKRQVAGSSGQGLFMAPFPEATLGCWLAAVGDERGSKVAPLHVKEYNDGALSFWHVAGNDLPLPFESRHLTPDRARLDLKRRVAAMFPEVSRRTDIVFPPRHAVHQATEESVVIRQPRNEPCVIQLPPSEGRGRRLTLVNGGTEPMLIDGTRGFLLANETADCIDAGGWVVMDYPSALERTVVHEDGKVILRQTRRLLSLLPAPPPEWSNVRGNSFTIGRPEPYCTVDDVRRQLGIVHVRDLDNREIQRAITDATGIIQSRWPDDSIRPEVVAANLILQRRGWPDRVPG